MNTHAEDPLQDPTFRQGFDAGWKLAVPAFELCVEKRRALQSSLREVAEALAKLCVDTGTEPLEGPIHIMIEKAQKLL